MITIISVLLLITACSQFVTDLSHLFKTQPATHYQCADGQQTITVTYLNQANNDLAWLSRVGKPAQLFVNVLSASGAKYVAGSEIWWTKGDQATLTDTTRPDYSLSCQVINVSD